MLNLALSTAQAPITGIEISGEPLIEKYGSLVFPLSVPEKVGETTTGEPILKEKVFPVACGVNFQDCVANRKYQELVPNSRYKSIAYWEQLGDATMNQAEMRQAHKSGLLVFDIPARLVVWLNIQKLNINNEAFQSCSIAAPVALQIEKALHNRAGFSITNDAYQNATVTYIFQGQEPKEYARVFGRYTYGNETAKFMLFPYDWVSLRYTVRLRINRNCVEDFTLGSPVECVDES